jgi:hypothetical protein
MREVSISSSVLNICGSEKPDVHVEGSSVQSLGVSPFYEDTSPQSPLLSFAHNPKAIAIDNGSVYVNCGDVALL